MLGYRVESRERNVGDLFTSERRQPGAIGVVLRVLPDGAKTPNDSRARNNSGSTRANKRIWGSDGIMAEQGRMASVFFLKRKFFVDRTEHMERRIV
jgi:hypothetical protein